MPVLTVPGRGQRLTPRWAQVLQCPILSNAQARLLEARGLQSLPWDFPTGWGLMTGRIQETSGPNQCPLGGRGSLLSLPQRTGCQEQTKHGRMA